MEQSSFDVDFHVTYESDIAHPQDVIYSENPDVHASVDTFVRAGLFTEEEARLVAERFIFPEADSILNYSVAAELRESGQADLDRAGKRYWDILVDQLTYRHGDLVQKLRILRKARGHHRNEEAILTTNLGAKRLNRMIQFANQIRQVRYDIVMDMHRAEAGKCNMVYPTCVPADRRITSTKQQEYLRQALVTYIRSAS